jgi:hypothetical protein
MSKYPYIPVFWSGKHSNKGGKKDWSVEDVNKMFTSTVAKGGKIPFTIDHPHNDLPVIGYTDFSNIRLVQDGQRAIIEVRPTEFAESILEQVKASGRKRVSIALSPTDFSIRHIGLVEKPAVKDLPAIPFEESDEPIKFELESEEPLFITNTQSQDITTDNKGESMDSNNPTPDPVLLKFEQENAELKAQIDKLKAEQAAIQTEKRMLEFKQYLLDNHSRQITPALQPKVLRLMMALDGQQEYEFTEDDKTVKTTPLEEFKSLLAMLPEQVNFGEFAHAGLTPGEMDNILDNIIDEFNKQRK